VPANDSGHGLGPSFLDLVRNIDTVQYNLVFGGTLVPPDDRLVIHFRFHVHFHIHIEGSCSLYPSYESGRLRSTSSPTSPASKNSAPGFGPNEKNDVPSVPGPIRL
jgi:hypothetical protein